MKKRHEPELAPMPLGLRLMIEEVMESRRTRKARIERWCFWGAVIIIALCAALPTVADWMGVGS